MPYITRSDKYAQIETLSNIKGALRCLENAKKSDSGAHGREIDGLITHLSGLADEISYNAGLKNLDEIALCALNGGYAYKENVAVNADDSRLSCKGLPTYISKNKASLAQ